MALGLGTGGGEGSRASPNAVQMVPLKCVGRGQLERELERELERGLEREPGRELERKPGLVIRVILPSRTMHPMVDRSTARLPPQSGSGTHPS